MPILLVIGAILKAIVLGFKFLGLKIFLLGTFLFRRLDILCGLIILFSLIGSMQLAWISGNWMILVRDAAMKVTLSDFRILINTQQLLDPTIGAVHPMFVFIDLWGNIIIWFLMLKLWHHIVERMTIETGSWASWLLAFFIVCLIELVLLVAINTEAGVFSIRTLQGWETVIPMQGFWYLIMNWPVLFYPAWGLWQQPYFQEQINATVNISQIIINNTTTSIGPETPMQNPLEVVFIPAGHT